MIQRIFVMDQTACRIFKFSNSPDTFWTFALVMFAPLCLTSRRYHCTLIYLMTTTKILISL